MNGTLDILKVIMALLVVGIHTEPFGFNIWLDRGFGIVTRLCVPFFFITSAYFYWLKDKGAMRFLKRILLLYLVWSIIYLPFDIKALSEMSIGQILYRYLWAGNEHALWYLCGSAIGFIITYLLLKIFKPRTVFIISLVVLIIGCLKSTWSPLLEQCFGIHVIDFLGSRNGLFYAFPYTALGMLAAKSKDQAKGRSVKKLMIGFVASFLALCVESIVFVIVLKTESTIMWVSVLPYTYFFFMLGNNIDIQIDKGKALLLRKISTLIYVSQYLFIPLWSKYCSTMVLFLLVSASTVIFSIVIIKLSEIKQLKWLSILY